MVRARPPESLPALSASTLGQIRLHQPQQWRRHSASYPHKGLLPCAWGAENRSSCMNSKSKLQKQACHAIDHSIHSSSWSLASKVVRKSDAHFSGRLISQGLGRSILRWAEPRCKWHIPALRVAKKASTDSNTSASCVIAKAEGSANVSIDCLPEGDGSSSAVRCTPTNHCCSLA
jgi:hypothetical protein